MKEKTIIWNSFNEIHHDEMLYWFNDPSWWNYRKNYMIRDPQCLPWLSLVGRSGLGNVNSLMMKALLIKFIYADLWEHIKKHPVNKGKVFEEKKMLSIAFIGYWKSLIVLDDVITGKSFRKILLITDNITILSINEN